MEDLTSGLQLHDHHNIGHGGLQFRQHGCKFIQSDPPEDLFSADFDKSWADEVRPDFLCLSSVVPSMV